MRPWPVVRNPDNSQLFLTAEWLVWPCTQAEAQFYGSVGKAGTRPPAGNTAVSYPQKISIAQ